MEIYLTANIHTFISLSLPFAALFFLWLSFTIFLLLMQCLRRISHLGLLRWINKFTPVYDAYFAPLKDKHHYWFGVLLLVRGILLATFIYASSPTIMLFILFYFLILFTTMAILLFYMSIKPIYKQKVLVEASFINLVILSGGIGIFSTYKSAFLYTSIGIAFIQFCATVLWNLLKPCHSRFRRCTPQRKGYLNIDESSNEIVHE